MLVFICCSSSRPHPHLVLPQPVAAAASSSTVKGNHVAPGEPITACAQSSPLPSVPASCRPSRTVDGLVLTSSVLAQRPRIVRRFPFPFVPASVARCPTVSHSTSSLSALVYHAAAIVSATPQVRNAYHNITHPFSCHHAAPRARQRRRQAAYRRECSRVILASSLARAHHGPLLTRRDGIPSAHRTRSAAPQIAPRTHQAGL